MNDRPVYLLSDEDISLDDDLDEDIFADDVIDELDFDKHLEREYDVDEGEDLYLDEDTKGEWEDEAAEYIRREDADIDNNRW